MVLTHRTCEIKAPFVSEHLIYRIWIMQFPGLRPVDSGITLVILFAMKTAISIPDPVFKTAERLAKRLGLSRSELYVRAISSYVEKHRSQKVTDLLNEVYGGMESQGLETGFKRAQMKSIDKEAW